MLDRIDLNIILASNNAVIIGASVGAVVGLILIVFSILLVYCLKKQKDRNKRTKSELNKLTETINSVTRRDLTPLPSLPSRILPSGFDESLISVSLILLPSSRVVSVCLWGVAIEPGRACSALLPSMRHLCGVRLAVGSVLGVCGRVPLNERTNGK